MPDVSILVYAHREDEERHERYAAWLKALVDGPEPFSLSLLVAIGFVRIVTNQRIYANPTPLPIALAAIDQLASHPRCRLAAPSPAHLSEVMRLRRAASTVGKLVADAGRRMLDGNAGWGTRKSNGVPATDRISPVGICR